MTNLHFSAHSDNSVKNPSVEGDGGAGAREMGEERVGSRREFQKGKLLLFVTAYHPVKETNPTTFLDFHLTFSEALSKIYM